MKYFNIKTEYGIETIDQLNINDFNDWREFRKELARLKKEYHLVGMNVYISQRATKEWYNN
jgi:hypothetical protein